MKRFAILCLLFASCTEADVTVGSKKFTESVVLGEVVTQLLTEDGVSAEHSSDLGGTRILWEGLLTGEIDAYVEYTGTLREEILAEEGIETDADLGPALAARGVRASAPLGFNNTYAIGMREGMAAELGIEAVSDLAQHPELAFGFGNEFLERSDGWPGLRARYGLPQKNVTGLDHDLAYRGLESGAIDVMDLYSTDAEIAHYGLRVLVDDRAYFPTYEAVLLTRLDLESRYPGTTACLARLEDAIDESRMIAMNERAKIAGVSEPLVAADFLRDVFGIDSVVFEPSFLQRLVARTGEHLLLVGVSLALAIAIALPLGILCALRESLGRFVLGVVGILQTIPSFAMFVFMIPAFGFGAKPTIAALFLYSLLPIVRGTHAGLASVPKELRESAAALGLSRGARLRLVELPLATRSILAGVQTSAVINVGTATIGAIIGARGYGRPILTGIRRDDLGLIMEGAVPAALLAILVQLVFEAIERRMLPRGLRLGSEGLA